MKQATRIVGPETARMLELGHPWVIADAYTRKWPAGQCGDLVELVDAQGRFLATALLDPGDRVAARVIARTPVRLDRRLVAERIRQAMLLRSCHCKADTDAFRLVNAEGDGLPGLTMDRYGKFALIQLYTEAWRPHLKLLTESLQDVVSPTGIYEKSRPRNTRGLEATGDSKQYGKLLAGDAASDPLRVRENGLSFLVTLQRGLNTGLFLDQREYRRYIFERAAGKRVLNLFSYTGSFSVAAAAGGASLVTSVDASPAYTAWAEQNFTVNRIDSRKHEFLVGDCLAVLDELVRKKRRYDIVVMDPPSFSTTTAGKFTTRGGTAEIVAALFPLLDKGGLLLSSTNHQKVELPDYLKELRRGALASGGDLRVIAAAGQPEDFPYPVTFPEGRYLKSVASVKV